MKICTRLNSRHDKLKQYLTAYKTNSEINFPDPPICSRSGVVVHYASVGENVKMACQVEAYPAQNLTVKWTYADQAETEAVVEKEISRYVNSNHRLMIV